MGFVFKSCSSEDLLEQQRSGWSGVKGRLRREDCEFVKHDKLFSNWKILVGPSDWSEHSTGKDGIDRYHLHNLPGGHFGPGVYELGVTAPSWSPTSHRQRTRTLKREDVMAVYVGQADNIRLRLQKYGQAGSHLEGSRLLSAKLYQGDDGSVSGGSSGSMWSQSSAESASKKSKHGPRLFSEVFALGSSIAFRWAQTDSKVVAEQVESELLAVFDYAWNKGSNGNRRSRDILAKLFMAWPASSSICIPGKKYLFCGTNAVGIKVALRRPQDTSSKNTLYKTLKTLPPQVPVSVRSPVKLASLELRCGVRTEEGTPCNSPPVKGRKRCPQHKGMRVRGAPAAGNALPATEESKADVSSVTREPVKVGAGSICLPRSLFRRQSVFLTKPVTARTPNVGTDCTAESKPECKPDGKELSFEPGERRRALSLSFNTWMKMENERVHDSPESPWAASEVAFGDTSSHKDCNQGSATSQRHRIPQTVSKYTPVSRNDSKRR